MKAPAIGGRYEFESRAMEVVANITPVNAPTSRSPSIAILTTPTRSLTTPDSDPKISGVEIATVMARVDAL